MIMNRPIAQSPFPLQAVLFDLDGTLLDTAPDFAVVVNQLRERHGRPPLDYRAIRETVSNGARALVTLALQLREGDPDFETARGELLDLYHRHLAVKSAPFPGIHELLDWLEHHRLPWAVVTNKPRRFAQPLLEALELAERCAALVCPDDVSKTKPDPEPLLLACRQLRCPPAHAIYLGDHRRDIEAGSNAGMRTLAAGYGYVDPTDPARDWRADFYVDRASDIQPLLQSLREPSPQGPSPQGQSL